MSVFLLGGYAATQIAEGGEAQDRDLERKKTAGLLWAVRQFNVGLYVSASSNLKAWHE